MGAAAAEGEAFGSRVGWADRLQGFWPLLDGGPFLGPCCLHDLHISHCGLQYFEKSYEHRPD